MRYRIEYADGRCNSYANGTNELIGKLQESKRGEIADVRKVFKSGATDSVMDIYAKHIGQKSVQGNKYKP